MAQVTIYLPDELEHEVKGAARDARKSLSAYFTELAHRAVRPHKWPQKLGDLYGAWEGDFPAVQDAPPPGAGAW